MTGKELIMFILRNDLENEELFRDGKIKGFIGMSEVAEKFDVGLATVATWYLLGILKGVSIGDNVYFPEDIENPLERTK